MRCQLIGCDKKIHPATEDYAMMCYEHWVSWLEDRVMPEDHPEDCPCEVC